MIIRFERLLRSRRKVVEKKVRFDKTGYFLN